VEIARELLNIARQALGVAIKKRCVAAAVFVECHCQRVFLVCSCRSSIPVPDTFAGEVIVEDANTPELAVDANDASIDAKKALDKNSTSGQSLFHDLLD